MDDSPIPDHLIDMLKESGDIDEDGKPVNDFFDPDEDDTFGTQRQRERITEEQNYYNDVPFGEMLFDGKTGDEVGDFTGSLMDTSINNAVFEFGFPVEFFLDMLCRWGVTLPINQNVRLGNMIDAEQAAALCEALTGLDASDVRDNYLDDSLEDVAFDLGIPLPDLLQACAAQKINLPRGGDTHITIDEYKLLLNSIMEGGEASRALKLFEENRMSTRWSGQKEANSRDLNKEDIAREIRKNNAGFGWRNGPPILGDGEGELPLEKAHIGGRIFGEEIFASVMASEGAEGVEAQQRQQQKKQQQQQPQQRQRQVEMGEVVWSPSRKRVLSSRMAAFAELASERSERDLRSWHDLHRWSISEVGDFWQSVSDFCGIKWLDRGSGHAYTPPPSTLPRPPGSATTGVGEGMRGRQRDDGVMTDARWFEGATLNFAHNLMPPPTDDEVIVSVSESPELESRRLTGKQLHVLVARCVRALRAARVSKGDRVAGVMVNSEEALVCMLGATAIGAIWSSCSPDFGVGGVSDRLGQISPKLVFFSLGYLYGGRWHDCRGLAKEVLAQLPDTEQGSPVGVGVPYWSTAAVGGRTAAGARSNGFSHPDPLSVSDLPTPLVPFEEFMGGARDSVGDDGGGKRPVGRGMGRPAGGEKEEVVEIEFEPTAFDHPVFIMFSSGTTGLPKCMVHGAGGTILQQKKELELHCDIKSGDRLLFFSTLGWMMWNWAAAVLSVEGATLVAFDGSPGHPDLAALWRVSAEEGVTHLGASPKYFGACKQKGVVPAVDCAADGEDGLENLRAILSTGSPLLPEHFQWIYEAVKSDVHLASISGGTDILGCFALGNPTLPVRAGHLQCLGLGMDVCAYRSSGGEDGSDGDRGDGGAAEVPAAASSRVAARGEMGELVCRTPFPSMPVCFWGDADGSKYRSAYFEAFEGEDVWAHGDYVKITEEAGVVISGRSDAVLNPGGVRIGTAEIYRQVEMVPEVEDSIAIGLRVNGDVEVVLFVTLVPTAEREGVATGGRGGGEGGEGGEEGGGAPNDVRGRWYALTGELEAKIKSIIRSNLTARHMPKRVVVVEGVPYTRSGKKVEVAATKSVHGEGVNNLSALANPEILRQFCEAGKALRGLVPFPPPPPPVSRL
eukprot:g6918.t1